METTDLTKSYYKIKDAADLVGVSQSTLRFWEQTFEEISPRRSKHNQRYFSPEDINILRMVKYLVKDKGLKIESAKEYLKTNRHNLSKRMEVVATLTRVREELEGMLHALTVRR